jgi:hypothetical protein
VSEFQAGGEEWSEIQEQFHGMPFSVVIDNAAKTCLTATPIAVLQGKVLAYFSNAYRTQHHVLMGIEAWSQDAAANHGLNSGLPSSVGELGAGAGAGGAAVHSPNLYKGGYMTDEHDRLAICAIIQHHMMPKSLTMSKIAQLAGTYHQSTRTRRGVAGSARRRQRQKVETNNTSWRDCECGGGWGERGGEKKRFGMPIRALPALSTLRRRGKHCDCRLG